MARTPDTDSSFLDVPPSMQRRSWRRSTPTQGATASLPNVMPEQRHGNRLRKKGSRLMRNRSDGEPRRGSDGDAESVDSRTSRASSALVITEPTTGSSPSNTGSLGTRMASWWSGLVSEGGREEGRWRRQSQPQTQGESSSSARGLLASAKQRAVGGVRYLLDGDAQPEGGDDIWVRGVVHRFPEGETATWPSSCECGFCIGLWAVGLTCE